MSENDRSPYMIPLVLGAFWNIIFGSIGFFYLPLHIDLFYTSVTPQAELLANIWCWLVVLLAGVGYGVVGLKHHKYRFFVSLGVLGKIAFSIFVADLWFAGVATNFAVAIAFGDFLWAIYFMAFLYSTRQYGYI
jgi:hypothetical protein